MPIKVISCLGQKIKGQLHTCWLPPLFLSSSMMMGPCMCLFRVSSVKGCTFCPVSRASCHKATSRSLAASASFLASALKGRLCEPKGKGRKSKGRNRKPTGHICLEANMDNNSRAVFDQEAIAGVSV